jgi:hypothetical protein
VLHNLLDNALRYMPAGGCIEVSLTEDATGLTLRVDGQQVSASGLGRSILKQAARRPGGQAHVENGLSGRGIAFVLRVAKTA